MNYNLDWPLLPIKRPHDYFNIGNQIANFVFFDTDHELYDKGLEGWYSGEVRLGYRHHDGCVSFRLNGIGPQDPERDKNGTPLDDKFKGYWGSGCSVPSIMTLDEFLFFKENSDKYIEWFEEICDVSRNYYKFAPIDKLDIARFAKHLLASV